MTTYCEYMLSASEDDINKKYHDNSYGFPLENESELFERFILEINQAGLSWVTILRKQENFRQAYDGFNVNTVASYTETDRERLLSDTGIIRNRLKINAAIENARRIQAMRKEFGSFKGWLDGHHPLELDEWIVLFKKTFVFTGGEIVNEFLMSTGYLPGAHDPGCPVNELILKKNPPWSRSKPGK